MPAQEQQENPRQYALRVLERDAAGVATRVMPVPLEEAGDDCVNPCGHKGYKLVHEAFHLVMACSVCGQGIGIV